MASLGLLAGTAACAGDGDTDRSRADDGAGVATFSEEAPAEDSVAMDTPEGSGGKPYREQSGAPQDAASARKVGRIAPTDRAVVRKGAISLASEDVGATRFDARDLIDQLGGEVAAEETGTDDDAVARVRMEIRVPEKSFDALMEGLAELGHLRSSSRSAEDVTTQVIDVETRIRSQQRSIARIQSLLAEAENLNQVIAIETQLAQRQADLESQQAKLAYLQDQSALSTITLSLVTVTPDDEAPASDEDESGFVAGLQDGWSGLTSVLATLATGVGMALPFGVVLAVLLTPVVLLIRRRPGRPSDPVEPAIGG